MLVPGAYVTGSPPSKSEPLARYLPPIPDGVASSWLEDRLPLSDHNDHPWILDPFCASPRLVIEAARAGYRVIVAANNPISRFLLETASNPPTEVELRAALAELAAARKGEERLELHIRSLYSTNCDHCGVEVMAEAYLWDRDNNQPFSRIYHCPHCGTSGEHPTTPYDLTRLSQFTGSGLHHARALERVTAIDDPDRQHVEEALGVYLPRALYALFTIINRLDSLPLTPPKKNHLFALCLTALDQANTLWQYPTSRARPRQLTIPPRFRENNVWLALEGAVQQWASTIPDISLVRWPNKPPPQGGIALYEGRLKDLVDSLLDIEISAVLAPIPRPNQAFWTLSALWAGWLWGREALGPFKSVLRRRRYDWSWHCIALNAALESLSPSLEVGTPILGLIGENEPGFLTAALVAAEAVNFELESLAMRPESGQVQIVWQRASVPQGTSTITDPERIRLFAETAQDQLRERGEPAGFITLQAASLMTLLQKHALGPALSLADVVSDLNTSFEDAFSYRRGFVRYGGSEKSLEVGQWWLKESNDVTTSLVDRVEREIVKQLIEKPGQALLEIDAQLCRAFPGLFTPSAELIQVCLESYGEPVLMDEDRWQLREQDAPKNRRADLDEIHDSLLSFSNRLGYKTEGDKPFLCYDNQGELRYAFFIIASALIGEVIIPCEYPPQKSLIVLPGGRANLVAYKLQHDPRLRQAVESGWRFIKFRQARTLLNIPKLTQETLDDQLAQDSLTYDAPQLRLF